MDEQFPLKTAFQWVEQHFNAMAYGDSKRAGQHRESLAKWLAFLTERVNDPELKSDLPKMVFMLSCKCIDFADVQVLEELARRADSGSGD